jgi:hypothetical protein
MQWSYSGASLDRGVKGKRERVVRISQEMGDDVWDSRGINDIQGVQYTSPSSTSILSVKFP